ncbi:MAG: hypothetical protein AB1545_14265 [Thermodesulfobacteriota bacterium]
MRGSIYSEQKCSLCGSAFTHDENRSGLFCPSHPDQRATGKFIVRFGRDITKRFSHFIDAERFLTGIRYEVDRNTFDVRDYKKDNPLGFENLASKWLIIKKRDLAYNSFRNVERYIRKGIDKWGQKSIKSIKFADIQELLYEQTCSSKTVYDMKTWLQQFFKWIADNEDWYRPPKFPEIKYELGWRTIIDKETQGRILDEVKRISFDYNPKIWLAIKWLSVYVKLRPIELLKLKEKEIGVNGFIVVPPKVAKERKSKIIPLLDEDIDFLNSMPRGFPDMPFFRHTKHTRGVRENRQFGRTYLYEWWKQACGNLGIEGVDLYGGTRHSTVTALSRYFSRDEIKEHATGHDTSKAFERYMQAEASKSLKMYQIAATQSNKPEQHPNNVIQVNFKNKSK